MGGDVAVGGGEVGEGFTPGGRVRGCGCGGDVAWDGGAWEEPDSEAGGAVFQGVDLGRCGVSRLIGW